MVGPCLLPIHASVGHVSRTPNGSGLAEGFRFRSLDLVPHWSVLRASSLGGEKSENVRLAHAGTGVEFALATAPVVSHFRSSQLLHVPASDTAGIPAIANSVPVPTAAVCHRCGKPAASLLHAR